MSFDCKTRIKEYSYIDFDGNQYEVFPSPFSQPFEGTCELVSVSTLQEFKNINIKNKIVLLEEKQPKVIIAKLDNIQCVD